MTGDQNSPKDLDPGLLEIWRCPQLGNPVSLKYCSEMNDGLFCPRIVACWGGTIDVVGWLSRKYSREAIERILGQPSKDRIARIIDGIEEGKRGAQGP